MGADNNRVSVAYIEETTFGTTPSGALQTMNFTGFTLKQDTETAESARIRSDRQIPDLARLNISVSGSISDEFSYDSHLTNLRDVLLSDAWTSEVTDVSGDTGIAADSLENKYTGIADEFANYTVGAIVKVEGFTETGNNGYARISAINSSDPGTTDNDELVVVGLTLTTEAAGDSVSITQLGYVKNGTNLRTRTYEKKRNDVASTFTIYRGVALDSMALTFADDAISTVEYTCMGKAADADATSTVGTSYVDAPDDDVMNGIDDLSAILRGGTSYAAKSIEINVANGVRAKNQLATLGAIELGTERCRVTGSVNAHFIGNTVLSEYMAFTDSSLDIKCIDEEGNMLWFYMPRIAITDADDPVDDGDSDSLLTFEYQALRDETMGFTILIARDSA